MLVRMIYMSDDDNNKGKQYKYLQGIRNIRNCTTIPEIMNMRPNGSTCNLDPRMRVERSKMIA